jgi:hypothetical protein
MKKIIIINSHEGSGSQALYYSMINHPSIHGCKEVNKENGYITDLDTLRVLSKKHKSKNKIQFFLDEINHNHLLSPNLNFKKLFIISFIRNPLESIEVICSSRNIEPKFALRHYEFRLNRIYQISKKAKESFFLTFNDLSNEEKIYNLEKKLDLRSKINFKKEILSYFKKTYMKNAIPKEIIKESEECYERYHYLLTRNPSQNVGLEIC